MGKSESKKRYIKLYTDVLNTAPTIASLTEIYETVIERAWKDYQRTETDKCKNIYGKITASLKNSQTLKLALDDLKCLYTMKNTLTKEEYKLLEKTMEEYFKIYHRDSQNSQEKLSTLSNTLSYLSARYISKFKESFKKDKREEYTQELRQYYMLNLNHPRIKERIEWESKKKYIPKTI